MSTRRMCWSTGSQPARITRRPLPDASEEVIEIEADEALIELIRGPGFAEHELEGPVGRCKTGRIDRRS